MKKTSRKGKITLSFIVICKSCLNREFSASLMCLLMLFVKKNSRENFRIFSNTLAHMAKVLKSNEVANYGIGLVARKSVIIVCDKVMVNQTRPRGYKTFFHAKLK